MADSKILFYFIIPFFFLMCKPQKSEEKDNQLSIPGVRTCFWSRGPVSSDPYINIAYPDAGVFCWGAGFTIPQGAKLELEGEYPHSRYSLLYTSPSRRDHRAARMPSFA